jgi:acetyl-CoA carboxylase biotin carboxyl carrier protein
MRVNEADPLSVDALLDAVCRTATQLSKTTNGSLRRISVQSGGTTVEVEWLEGVALMGSGRAAVAPPSTHEAMTEEVDTRLCYVCAPMVGTFYLAPEPGAKPFVVEGDMVEQGQQVGILEAMKLMNAIEADCSGHVVEILVPDATPVEYGQRLIALTPLDGA